MTLFVRVLVTFPVRVLVTFPVSVLVTFPVIAGLTRNLTLGGLDCGSEAAVTVSLWRSMAFRH